MLAYRFIALLDFLKAVIADIVPLQARLAKKE
jgi:hypothetical protein